MNQPSDSCSDIDIEYGDYDDFEPTEQRLRSLNDETPNLYSADLGTFDDFKSDNNCYWDGSDAGDKSLTLDQRIEQSPSFDESDLDPDDDDDDDQPRISETALAVACEAIHESFVDHEYNEMMIIAEENRQQEQQMSPTGDSADRYEPPEVERPEFLDSMDKIIDDSYDRKQGREQTEEFLDTVNNIALDSFDGDLLDSSFDQKKEMEQSRIFLNTLSHIASDSCKLDDIGIGRVRTLDTVTVEDDIESSGDLSPKSTTAEKKKKKACCDTVTCLLLIVVIVCVLVAGIVAVAFYMFGVPNPMLFFEDSGDMEGDIFFDDVIFDDSSIDMSTYKYDKWETKKQGKGLELYIENALDDTWSPYLEEYEALYDEAEPDSLSLKIWKVQADSECSPSFGRLKVCNGDYGDTTWEGINLSLIHDGYIKWSTSKMNDFFLAGEDDEKKGYTMCHEMGHGFGLSHSDENYHNRNRGDCMDYTSRPKGNLLPGRYNHEILSRIYGTIPSKRRRGLEESVPDDIVNKYFETEQEMMLQCNDTECITDIGDGYQVKAHALLVGRD